MTVLKRYSRRRAAAPAAAALGVLAGLYASASPLRVRPAPPAPEAIPAALAVSWRAGDTVASGPTAFGLIGDAVATPSGEVFVLDVMERRVGYASRSQPVIWTGRGGQGPGEFFMPVSLAVAKSGNVYVLDRGNQRVERYAVVANGLKHVGGFSLTFVAEDMCALNDRLFVLAAFDGRAIHEISPQNGRVLSSFAPDPRLTDELMATFGAGGYLACGPGEEISHLSMLLPQVQRFSAATGRLLGTAPIPGYRAVEVRRVGNGVVFNAPDGVHDRAASLTTLPDARLLVQVGHLRPGAATGHEFASLRSYVLQWPQGTFQPLSGDLPRVTSATGDEALAIHTDPAPSLQRLTLLIPPATGP